jgi:hypothetical protein
MCRNGDQLPAELENFSLFSDILISWRVKVPHFCVNRPLTVIDATYDLQSIVSHYFEQGFVVIPSHYFLALTGKWPKRPQAPLQSLGGRASSRLDPDSTRVSQGYHRQKLHSIREEMDEEDQGISCEFTNALEGEGNGTESDGDLDMYEWDETTLHEHFLSDQYVSSPIYDLIHSIRS